MKKIKDPLLFEKIRDFLRNYMPVLRKKSPNTVVAYQYTLNLYLMFLQLTFSKTLIEVTAADFTQANILSFLDWLMNDRRNSISSRNLRLSHMRKFCEYLMEKDVLSIPKLNEIKKIAKTPDPKSAEIIFLSIADTRLVLSQPDTTRKSGIRDRFFLSLLYDSGCRVQEMLDLRMKDFIPGKEGAELHIVGKGAKHRVTPISKEVKKMFDEYCLSYHPQMDYNEFLFYTNRKQILTPMSRDNVERFIKKYENKAKKTNPDLEHLHAHLFRHSRSMHLYMAGMPLELISQWLGHSQLETSLIYARATTEMKRNAIEKISQKDDSVFRDEEKFKYSNDDETIKRLYGLK